MKKRKTNLDKKKKEKRKKENLFVAVRDFIYRPPEAVPRWT
jgi:hypothetical protein